MIQFLTFTLSVLLNFSSPNSNTIKPINKILYIIENSCLESDSTEFATLFVYRPRNALFGPTYDMYIDDAEMTGKLFIKKIKGNTYREIKIYNEGEHVFWAKTLEAKVSVKVNIKFGKVYYLRCGFTQGVIKNRPKLEFVDQGEGEREYKKQ